ncbi:hypothetical protein MesoLjLc_37370 [Mesorhizobium sp. L-8-10]|nr:hypothetical protein MesoLjLc_37370 [Mesorhizobium sp. L-8-10]
MREVGATNRTQARSREDDACREARFGRTLGDRKVGHCVPIAKVAPKAVLLQSGKGFGDAAKGPSSGCRRTPFWMKVPRVFVPLSVLPDISPTRGGRPAGRLDFANRQRRKTSAIIDDSQSPPCGGDVRQDREGYLAKPYPTEIKKLSALLSWQGRFTEVDEIRSLRSDAHFQSRWRSRWAVSHLEALMQRASKGYPR